MQLFLLSFMLLVTSVSDRAVAGISTVIENSADSFVYDIDFDKKYQNYLYDEADTYSTYKLAMAMIGYESRFDPDAKHYNKNGTIDMGLAQINSRYLDYYEEIYDMKIDPYDPYDAMKFLIRKIEDEKSFWEDKVKDKYINYCVMGSYNRGRVSYRRYIRNNGFNCSYTDSVMDVYNSLQLKIK